ncbi:HAD family hydrolase [Enterococcus sp. AZ103]|uniref:HAD family hydrolase n=1 Tax=Enterococcus sp. AZ103 TaxID=2774628 RepID=UPI003F252582
MFKTILFDVDGTLIDTAYVMTHSLQKTLLEEMQLSVEIDDLNYVLGIPGRAALEEFTADEAELEKLLKAWNKNVLLYAEHVSVYPEIEEILKKLKAAGIKMGVVTSKTSNEMKTEFDIFNLNHYFDVFITASDTENHKPHPEPIQKAIDLLSVEKGETIYIGDSLYDMKSAKACGIKFAVANWGALDLAMFTEADYFLKKPSDLLNLI